MNTHDQISEMLTAFALGELSPAETEEVESHLSECADCAVQLEAMRAVLESAEAVSQISADEEICEAAEQSILETVATAPIPRPPVAPESLWRKTVTTKRFKFAAAAAVVIGLLTASYFFPNTVTGTVFADVIKNVVEAESITFHTRQRLGTGPIVVSRMYIQGPKLRMDIEAMESDQPGAEKLKEQMQEMKLPAILTNIVDFEKKDGIELDHFRKAFKKLEIDDRMVAEFTRSNPIRQFRNVKPENAEFLQTESREGQEIDIFLVKHVDLMGIKAELSGEEGQRMTVWVDRATRLPVRILLEVSAHVEGKSRDFFEFYDFVWNESPPEDIFNLNPPDGYTLKTETNPPAS
ncbi:MAG: anti-sigma factor family protein [Planctomycetota bacterium]|jgi:hypothetical protein